MEVKEAGEVATDPVLLGSWRQQYYQILESCRGFVSRFVTQNSVPEDNRSR